MGSAFGMTIGELLAVDMPPGPAWVDVVHRCWSEGVAFLPLDTRWTPAERRRVMDLAQPAAVLDPIGETTVFGGAGPIAPDVALVVATSGTGGEPKLAEIPRSAVAAAVRGSTEALDGDEPPSDEHTWVACLTPAHVGGLLVMLRAELTGTSLVVHERFDASATIRALQERSRITVSVVASMLARLLELDARLEGCTLLVGGGPVQQASVRRARDLGARVVLTYGTTETCGGVVYDGLPFEGTQIRIATGTEPAIEARGPTLFSGYRGDPGATGAAFDTTGWFRTRDLGMFDERDRLVVLGRADDAIRTGGETVWPEEVETIVRSHAGVADVAVAGRPHPTWGQQVVAYVVPTDPADPPSGDRITSWVRERAASFKAPRRVVVVDAIPRTPSGKIARRRLPA